MQINPRLLIVAIVCVVAIAGVMLWRSAVDKPQYSGSMAGHPGQGPMTGSPAGMRIPGASQPVSANKK